MILANDQMDNLRRVTDLVLELDGAIDAKHYDELSEEKFEGEPDDSEFCVNLTFGQLRRLTIAALAAQAIQRSQGIFSATTVTGDKP